MLEAAIEAYLVQRVTAIGGDCLKGAVPGRRFIDRICIFPNGVTAYAECKKPHGGRKEKHQLETIKRLVDKGHVARFMNTKTDVDGFIIECKARMSERAFKE